MMSAKEQEQKLIEIGNRLLQIQLQANDNLVLMRHLEDAIGNVKLAQLSIVDPELKPYDNGDEFLDDIIKVYKKLGAPLINIATDKIFVRNRQHPAAMQTMNYITDNLTNRTFVFDEYILEIQDLYDHYEWHTGLDKDTWHRFGKRVEPTDVEAMIKEDLDAVLQPDDIEKIKLEVQRILSITKEEVNKLSDEEVKARVQNFVKEHMPTMVTLENDKGEERTLDARIINQYYNVDVISDETISGAPEDGYVCKAKIVFTPKPQFGIPTNEWYEIMRSIADQECDTK